MNEKSIFNLTTSIINASCSLIFLILVVIFQAIKNNILGVIFLSIFFFTLIIYYILKSIYYGLDNSDSKDLMYKISDIFKYISIIILTIYFILNLDFGIKWILFGIVCFLGLFYIFISIFDSLKILKYIFGFILLLINLFLILNIYNINILFYIIFLSIIVYYISNLIGELLNNKLILSLDFVSIILLGIFLIFI